MHKFLRLLIILIFVWAITLPWTLMYFNTITSSSSNEISLVWKRIRGEKHNSEPTKDNVVIGVVACGEKSLNSTLVLLKSAIASGIYHGLYSLEAILFADDDHLYEMDIKVEELRKFSQGARLLFRYEIHPVVFPARNHDEWKNLFKPCSTQRLFLHSALPHISEILYLDSDTLVTGDLKEIWGKFRIMSSEQAVGLVPEHEISTIGWYNRFARHPFYPPLGLNAGVMLMNLSRLRLHKNLDWEGGIFNAYKTYKNKIAFGDQDLINIFFHEHPDAVYLLPCSFNYRTDHCMYGQNCKLLENESSVSEIKLVHGSRDAFQKNAFPLFKQLFEYFKKFRPQDDYVKDIIQPFKRNVSMWNQRIRSLTHNANITLDCDSIGHSFFKFI